MSDPAVRRINFRISQQARRGFEVVRNGFNAHSADPAAVLCIGWGRFIPHVGAPFENVVVSYCGRSQETEFAAAIQEVEGIKIVFITTETDHQKFNGRILDFDDNTGFFLRQP